MVEQINALALLKEEMQTEEIHLKVNAIHRLKTVVLSIGLENTVSQLLPYLQTLTEEQDDEVLFAIAEELGKCFVLLQDKAIFLPLLEELAKHDETVVREEATKSLTLICDALDDDEIQNIFCPIITRLAGAEWFTGRVSACSLFERAYPRAGAQKERLRRKFLELCQDDTPMIKRVCASKLGTFATKLEKQHVIQELLPIFRELSQDDQDSCRVLCIESLIPMAGYLSKEENRVHTLGSLLNAGEDKSWKVRLSFARNFAKFAEAFGTDITDNNLIQTFNLLLNDNEPEVKNAAIASLSQSLKNLSTEKICNIILPTLSSTVADSQVAFKAGVGLALCEMANIVGKTYCINTVIPILQDLLRDDNSEVRLNVASNMHRLAQQVGSEMLSGNLLSILTPMTKDTQWRVRMAVFELIGKLSIAFGKDIFMRSLSDIFMTYLTNTAASVRGMGVTMVGQLASNFGPDWVTDHLIPKVVESYNVEQQGYNYRMCALETLSAVMPVLRKETITEKVLPILVKACTDRIPNVQFCVARIIQANYRLIDESEFNATLAPKLRDMAHESDKDVAYFAYTAIQAYQNRAEAK